MRWIIAPLLAAVILCGSGFMRALEDTTESSVALAEASKSGPKTTEEAVEDVAALPAVALLTGRQAEAMRALADALEVSAKRVIDLNASIGRQLSSIRSLRGTVGRVDDSMTCITNRLERLVAAAGQAPGRLGDIAATIDVLQAAQGKSIRHLRSINRKLTALGVVAGATDVEVPPAPGDASAPSGGPPPKALDC